MDKPTSPVGQGRRVPIAELHMPEPNTGCWLWLGTVGAGGYGVRGKRKAHRVVWESLCGPVPASLTLDHLCRNRICVNPDHLEPVTFAENVRRGVSPSALNARKTACKNGHEFDGANTYLGPDGRRCRKCRRASSRAFLARNGFTSMGSMYR